MSIFKKLLGEPEPHGLDSLRPVPPVPVPGPPWKKGDPPPADIDDMPDCCCRHRCRCGR